ncbi:hypothetical protein BT69DRAFT_1281740, partial [Atractiella rhizophila]
MTIILPALIQIHQTESSSYARYLLERTVLQSKSSASQQMEPVSGVENPVKNSDCACGAVAPSFPSFAPHQKALDRVVVMPRREFQ